MGPGKASGPHPIQEPQLANLLLPLPFLLASLPPTLPFFLPSLVPTPYPAQPCRNFSNKGGHRKSTQQVPVLAHFSCRAWPHGGYSRPAPCTPTPRVYHKFYLMHSPWHRPSLRKAGK